MKKVDLVVPCYNEQESIPLFYNEIKKVSKDINAKINIIFVNDGSKDNTLEIMKDLAKKDNIVKYISFSRNFGKEAAMQAGLEKCKDKDAVIIMDADLQHPPKVLLPMYVAMETGADWCIPSRLIPGGDDGGLNWYRKLISGTARAIGQIMLPCLRKISDPTSGLFMIRKDIIAEADMRPVGWKIMVEVLATAKYKKIIEIPYTFAERVAGESKIDSKATMQYLEQCFSLRKRAVKNKNVIVRRWTKKRMDELVEKYIKKRKLDTI